MSINHEVNERPTSELETVTPGEPIRMEIAMSSDGYHVAVAMDAQVSNELFQFVLGRVAYARRFMQAAVGLPPMELMASQTDEDPPVGDPV